MATKEAVELAIVPVLEEALSNIDHDRALAATVLTQLILLINGSKDSGRFKENGGIAAKLVESLQRSNEQLIKIAAVLARQGDVEGEELSEDETDELLDELTNVSEDEA